MLPDINGTVVCQRLRSNPELADIKVLCISGVVNQQEVQQLMDAGANGFLKKPFQMTELMVKLSELLELEAGSTGTNGTEHA
jgi:CheY-like chemotaxis protein